MRAAAVLIAIVAGLLLFGLVTDHVLFDTVIDTYWEYDGKKMHTVWFAGSDDELKFKSKYPDAEIVSQKTERRFIGN